MERIKSAFIGLGMAFLAGCAGNKVRYETVEGKVNEGIYEGLFYLVDFNREGNTIQIRGYGGMSKTGLRVYGFDRDRDENFEIKDARNIEFDSGELNRIISEAENRKVK